MKKKVLYLIVLLIILLPLNVFAATDTSFSSDYNWYNPKTKSGAWTDYRSGVINNVYLQGGITAENFNTYNLEVLRSISNEWKNVSITKDNLYAFYYTITIDNIQNEEVLSLDFINNSSNFYTSSGNAELLSSSLIANYWEQTGISEVNYNPIDVGIQTIKLKFIVKATNTDNSTHVVITKNLSDYIVGRHIATTIVRVTSSSYELITDNTLINKQDELISQQEQTNQKIDDLNDNITNSNVNSDNANGFFNNYKDNDYGLTSIITAPLSFIQNLTNNSCSEIVLPLPFVDNNISLPCMSTIYSNHFQSVFNLYQIITTGFISYWVAIRIYALVKGFKDPENDRIEVMDL